MIEYLPWSKEVVNTAVSSLKDNVFSTLDIELSGACPYNCLYCETPYRDRKSLVNFVKLEEFIKSRQFKWIYICGIGEPTYADNKKYLLKLLSSCQANGVKCSIFTNLSCLDNDLLQYIENEVLYLIIKYDSHNADTISKVYRPNDINIYLSNLRKIMDYVKVKDNKTNIAASIVPTTANRKEIEILVQSCIERGIFPLLGQLEYSGAAKATYDELFLDDDELAAIKYRVEEKIGEQYNIPFCPSVITGFHISNDNKVTLDKRTGLSCHWFWLDEPMVDVLCELNDTATIPNITSQILQIREKKFFELFKHRQSFASDIFGGCGGNKRDIFDIYFNIMKEVEV